MKVAVVGLWHLGTVISVCLAGAGHSVVAYDERSAVVDALCGGSLPVFEPGLLDRMASVVKSGHLRFTNNPKDLGEPEVLWVTYDTPVDEEDRADVKYVVDQVRSLLLGQDLETLVLISSQVPAGTTSKLETWYRDVKPDGKTTFAYSPENLRLGEAIESFTHPGRVVIGAGNQSDRDQLTTLFGSFSDQIEWMSVESAEMSKHGLNAFLATSVAFANELAILCERVGADAREVERALRSDSRVGPKAYIRAGSAFAGGTLARDLMFLSEIGRETGTPTHLFDGVQRSNRVHINWVQKTLSAELGKLQDQTIAVLGLTYKPGTNTLRRSSAVSWCRWLAEGGAHVKAFDPAIFVLPVELSSFISLQASTEDALAGSSAALIATEWPGFVDIRVDDIIRWMKRPLVLDAGRFLETQLGFDRRVRYLAVGRGT